MNGVRARARGLASLASHYGGVRAVYDASPFYSPGPYEAWLAAACIQRMELRSSHALADLGGGSGGFAAKLRELTNARFVSVVDPSAGMLAGAEADARVDSAECADALGWATGSPDTDSRRPARYERILLKEVIHHIEPQERAQVFQSLKDSRLTSQDGKLLIVTRPQHDIDYPLWEAALEVWAENQPSETSIVNELKAAGFSDVTTHLHTYPHEVPVDKWCQLVKGRFWSTFSHFTDEELELGAEQIRAKAAIGAQDAAGLLRFEDRLLLIVAA